MTTPKDIFRTQFGAYMRTVRALELTGQARTRILGAAKGPGQLEITVGNTTTALGPHLSKDLARRKTKKH